MIDRVEFDRRLDDAGKQFQRDIKRADEVAYYGRACNPWWAFKHRLFARWKAQELREGARRRHDLTFNQAWKLATDRQASDQGDS